MAVAPHCRLPEPQALAYVTPSSAASLGECKLRAAYGSDPEFRRTVPSSPAARLGTACHEVLELAGAGGLPSSDDPAWRDAFEDAWMRAIERQMEASRVSRLEAHWPPPQRWRNYSMRKVATRQLARRIGLSACRDGAADAVPSGATARTVQEERQEACGGRLRGRADVIHRGERSEIEDYKSGSIYEDGVDEIKPYYRTQMLLYAVLEQENSGVWPDRATLIPLDGDPATIEIDAAQAEATAAAALTALDDYNAAIEVGVGGEDLASPSPDACRFCPYAIECPGFWSTADENWLDAGILAVAGRLESVHESRLDTFNVRVEADAGSVGTGACLLYGLDAERFGALLEADSAAAVAATWLLGNPEERQFRAGQRTQISVG